MTFSYWKYRASGEIVIARTLSDGSSEVCDELITRQDATLANIEDLANNLCGGLWSAVADDDETFALYEPTT